MMKTRLRPGLAVRGLLLLLGLSGLSVEAVARSGNYLIVTAQDYGNAPAMNQFVDAKTAQGFAVTKYVVPVGTSNTTLRSYIRGLWGGPNSPDYILIVGDTTGYTATASMVPHFTGSASRAACTDVYYACMDDGDDWYPEIPIGRFSVRSAIELQNLVKKSLYVENGVFEDPAYMKHATFLATSDTTSGSEETHDWVIDTLLTPADFECTRVYARLGGGTADVTAAVNAGNMFLVYGGHSSSSGWSEPSYHQDDVRNLVNENLYPFVFGWSCNSANYAGSDECFGETWIRVADKGAAAYLSASALIFWGDWEAWEPSRQLERYLFKTIFEDQVWEVGPAWHATRYLMLADYGGWDGNPAHQPTQNYDVCRNFFEEFVLLGDPSLLLPGGVGFTLSAEPDEQSLCVNTATQTVYEIDVAQLGDFAENVTLTCSGAPPGATVGFSVNDQAPPFISELTVGDLGACAPGTYDIQVRGLAAEVDRRITVTLILANDPPGDVTLGSPPNGAVEVARTPTLTWQPAVQAGRYEVELAHDAGFADVVESAVCHEPAYECGTRLDGLTTYYWHVRAVNGCGTGAYSSTFAFTTMDQPDYFTQQFTSSPDLDNFTVAFLPDNTGDYYEICGGAAMAFPTDPAGGTVVAPGEDGSSLATLAGATVQLYGEVYNAFYINSNGNITFGGGDGTWQETLTAHFSRARISGLFNDFSPQNGGTVSWKQLADRAAVTFQNVPDYNSSNRSSFQIEMFFNGEIHMTWLEVNTANAIVGLSEGLGLPVDYIASDLSAAGPCGSDFTLSVQPATQEVCIPDDAQYTIELLPIQGFDEPVTLSAEDLPAGVLANFSVNPVTPPSTSVLTLTQTGMAEPGAHVFTVIGTSAEAQKTREAGLDLAAPVVVPAVLIAPENGDNAVPLLAEFTWQAVANAFAYDLEISDDVNFAHISHAARVDDAGYTLDEPLVGSTHYYWHVRGVNACGEGPYSGAASFFTVNRVMPVAYDMPNGQSGSYTYYDDAYDGDGDNNTPLAPLSNGLGDLTDGAIASAHWNVTPGPYVGWVSVDPTITFHFDGQVEIDAVTLYLDDAGGGGSVHVPVDVTLVMGGATREFTCADPPGDEPFAFVLEGLELAGNALALTIADHSTSGYMMLSEVEFHGPTPVPCSGDLDGDDDVDLSDLARLLASYGLTSGAAYEDGDLDLDGDVDLTDLAALLAVYGSPCP